MTIAELRTILDLAAKCLNDGENAEVFLEDDEGDAYTITECRLFSLGDGKIIPGRLILL